MKYKVAISTSEGTCDLVIEADRVDYWSDDGPTIILTNDNKTVAVFPSHTLIYLCAEDKLVKEA